MKKTIHPNSAPESLQEIVALAINNQGYYVLETDVSEQLKADPQPYLSVLKAIGKTFSKTYAWKVIKSQSEQDFLPIHTESIYAPKIPSFFALAILKKAAFGGNTILYDGRKAAVLLKSKHPELSCVRIRYKTKFYKDVSACHPLVETLKCGQEVLRFRSAPEFNSIENLPDNYTEKSFYNTMHHILNECIILNRPLSEGELIIVNNDLLLHSRGSFDGERVILRVRFDDPMNKGQTY